MKTTNLNSLRVLEMGHLREDTRRGSGSERAPFQRISPRDHAGLRCQVVRSVEIAILAYD
jgi:hypothetical protein